jgi:hypothetical protein
MLDVCRRRADQLLQLLLLQFKGLRPARVIFRQRNGAALLSNIGAHDHQSSSDRERRAGDKVDSSKIVIPGRVAERREGKGNHLWNGSPFPRHD